MTTETSGRAFSLGHCMAGKCPVGIWLDGAESAEAEPRGWLWGCGKGLRIESILLLQFGSK
ncbi:hypothetical protein DC522_00015 [Microvirga sp. KLBC 81]|nr:hypothetical protein DC522_00015 [Microvirga sp. KLBC 81]